MKLFSAFILFLLLFAFSVNAVFACTSSPSPLPSTAVLENADIIVRGRLIEVDDRGYSAIVQVASYFRGSGSEYLVIMRFPASLQTTRAIRQYSTNCLYAGDGNPLELDSIGYFALENNQDGTFRDYSSQMFYIEDGQVNYIDGDYSTGENVTSSTETFETDLLEYSDYSTPLSPDFENSRYPLMKFLLITTESGQRYRYNPDYSLTSLDDTYPIAISPDGAHVVFEQSDTTLGFSYYWTDRDVFQSDYYPELINHEGEVVAFSPNSDFVAVWDADHLSLFMYNNYEYAGYGQRMQMQEIGFVRWQSFKRQVVWSPDSSTISYTTIDGLWKWNIYTDVEPQLVISIDNSIASTEDSDVQQEPNILDLSLNGQYIRYGEMDNWTLLEVATGQTYHNAIATPDEQNLIFIGVDYDEILYDPQNRDCGIPLSETCPIYIRHTPSDVFWYRYDQIAVVTCSDEYDNCYIETHSWNLSSDQQSNYDAVYLWVVLPYARNIIYDYSYDTPVVVVGDYLIEFGFQPGYMEERDMIDLSDELDSPIVGIEWEQAIFYIQP